MYAHPQHGVDHEEVKALRQLAGRWLRDKRESAGLSQRELAERVGFERYAFISQIEAGRGRVPPDRYEDFAEALSVDVRDMARTMLRYYDPVTHRILFERSEPRGTPKAVVTSPVTDSEDDNVESLLRRQMEAMEARLERIEKRLLVRRTRKSSAQQTS